MNTLETISFAYLIWVLPGKPTYTLRKVFSEENFSKIIKPLLLPCDGAVDTLPCSTYSKIDCPQYCRRQIFYWEPDDKFIAYCPEHQAADEIVDEENLRLFNVNLPAVLKDFAKCMRINGKVESYMDDKLIWCLGELSSSASKRHPVFFIANLNPNIIADKIQTLLLRIKKESLIFTPGAYVPDSQLSDLLLTKKVSIFNIDECASVGDGGKVYIQIEPAKLFADFVEKIHIKKTTLLGFDLPLGTSWEDLSIHFKDAQSLTIYIKGIVHSVLKEKMWIGDAQWELLRKFSDGYGQYNSTNIVGSDAKKKQLERLNKGLMQYFKRNDKPIYLENGMYKCRFKLKPDWHSTNYHPPLR